MLICLLVQEPFQGAEAAHCQQLYIAGIALAALLDVVTTVYQSPLVVIIPQHQVDQVATMGLDVPRCFSAA